MKFCDEYHRGDWYQYLDEFKFELFTDVRWIKDWPGPCGPCHLSDLGNLYDKQFRNPSVTIIPEDQEIIGFKHSADNDFVNIDSDDEEEEVFDLKDL